MECKYMKISSRYTWMNRLMQSWKIMVISRWNIEGVLQSPICITWLLNMPSTVVNTILWMCVPVRCIFVHMLWTYWALSDMPPWPYHYEWYLGQGMGSRPWPCYCSVLINQKQYVVYCFSSVCRALAPLDVPLRVSTTVQWCISQFSERVLHGNALGISAVGSGCASWDQLKWSHGLLPR